MISSNISKHFEEICPASLNRFVNTKKIEKNFSMFFFRREKFTSPMLRVSYCMLSEMTK